MFERYTERSRRTLFFARYEATQAGAAAIEPEDFLLGLLREGKSIGPVLARAGITLESAGAELRRIAQARDKATSASIEIPFSVATKEILQLAMVEADRLGDRDIRPEHLLAGILRQGSSRAAHLLSRHGVEATAIASTARTTDALERRPDIPPSDAVRVSVSTRGPGTSSRRGLDHWMLEGFSLRTALAEIYEFPPTRIDLEPALDLDDRYDFYLMPDRAPDPHGIGELMQDAVARHFRLGVARETRRMEALVVTAPHGIRAPQESATGGGGLGAMSSQDVVLEADVLSMDELRQRAEAQLRAMIAGRGALPINSMSGSMSIDAFCHLLERSTGRIVIDESGVSGTYRLDVRDDRQNPDDFLRVLADETGLVVTPAPREVEILVVKRHVARVDGVG